MRRIVVIVLVLAGIMGSTVAASASAVRSSPGVCDDPNAPCWMQGESWHEGISRTWGFGVLPGWVIPTGAGVGFLNTGANIPHFVVVINPRGSRVLYDPVASMHTSHGAHPLAAHQFAWADRSLPGIWGRCWMERSSGSGCASLPQSILPGHGRICTPTSLHQEESPGAIRFTLRQRRCAHRNIDVHA